MKKLNARAVSLLFAAFLVIVCLASAAFILLSPDDLPSAAADNTSGNLLAGGAFASGDGIAFFLEDGDLYSLFDGRKSLIKSGTSAPLFVTEGAPVFMREGSLYHTLSDGSGEVLLAEQVENPLILGRWIYCTEKGELVKFRMDDGRRRSLGLYPRGKYAVSATRIYYLEDDGYLYTARTDGSERALVAPYKMTDFIIGGNYIFYRDESRVLCWFPASSPEARAEHREVSGYNYLDGKVIYRSEGSIYALDMQSMSVSEITADTSAKTALYCDDSYVYFYDAAGKFSRISPDGSGKQSF